MKLKIEEEVFLEVLITVAKMIQIDLFYFQAEFRSILITQINKKVGSSLISYLLSCQPNPNLT